MTTRPHDDLLFRLRTHCETAYKNEEEAADVIEAQAAEFERLRTVIYAYSTIEAARRIGRHPPEKCLDVVGCFHRDEQLAAEAAKEKS
jgi:hypothetical protein